MEIAGCLFTARHGYFSRTVVNKIKQLHIAAKCAIWLQARNVPNFAS